MYADPTHIRNNRLNLSLNDTEMRAIEALADFNGLQRSAFAREVLMEGLRLMHERKSAQGPQEMRHANA